MKKGAVKYLATALGIGALQDPQLAEAMGPVKLKEMDQGPETQSPDPAELEGLTRKKLFSGKPHRHAYRQDKGGNWVCGCGLELPKKVKPVKYVK